jgi:site-specific DNA recombinase
LDLPVFNVYADTASAGSLDRPQLDQLRDDIAAGLVTHVVALAWDRLARDVGGQLVLLEELERKRVELHLVQGGKHEADSDEGRFMGTVLGAANEYARDKIRERARRGRLGKAKRGRITLNGVAPFGYRLVGEKSGWLEVVPEEAAVVQRIFKDYALPGSSSLTAVCNTLLGTPTPSESGHAPAGLSRGHKRAKGVWNESSLRAILLNRLYGFGEWEYRRTRVPRKGGRVTTAPEDRVIVPGLPTIVTPDLQEKAIARLEQNKRRRDGKRKAPYYLSGYLVCSECGLHWTGYATIYHGRAYRYYRCGGRQKKSSLDGKTRRCNMPPIRADRAEALTVSAVRGWIEQYDKVALEEGWDVAADIMEDLRNENSARDFDGELATIEAKRARLIAALDQTGAGKSAKTIGDKLKSLDVEEERIRREEAATTNTQAVRHTLETVRATLQDGLAQLAPEHLPEFLQGTGSLVYVNDSLPVLKVVLGANLQSGVSALG